MKELGELHLRRWSVSPKGIFSLLLGWLSLALSAQAVTVAWDANPEPDIAGYRVHYGTSSGNYTVVMDALNNTTATVSNLTTGSTYFFAVTAYNTAGLESLPSNEVSATVTTTGGNTAPTISNIADQSTPVGAAMGPLNFTVADIETAVASLTVSGSSSDQTLVPNGSIVFGGSGANRTVTVTPATGQTGTVTITVSLSDGALTASDTFILTVNAVPTESLVAAYGFNEGSGTSVTDASGNGNSGAIGAAAWTPSGKYGQALSFNGTSAWVTVNDSNSLDLTTGMTLEAWVYPTAVGGWRDVIYKGPDDIYYLEGSSDNSTPALGGTYSSSRLGGTTSLPLNTWTHLAGTYDGATMRLYLNGVQVTSRAQTGPIQTSTGALTIGGDALYGQYFAGRIDEVRVYNRALSVAEIQTDMNTAVNATPNAAPTISNLANQVVSEDTSTGAVVFTVGDAETAAGSLTLSGSSSNPTLVPVSGMAFGGSGANRTVTVMPTANQSGTATITVTVNDGALTASNSFLLTVTAVNDAPVATNGTLAVTEDVAKTGTLAATDADGDALTYSMVAQGTKGTVAITNSTTGAFTYTPNANASGSDSFTFKATDVGGLASNVATVTVTITAANDAPVATNGTLAVTEDVAKTGTLAATDADGDSLTYSVVAQGAKGTVAITNSTTGAFTYTPNANASGSDSFTFKATDVGGLASNVATVTVTITAANDAPVATNGTLAVTEDVAKTGTLAATDADGDSLTYSVVAQGTKGAVTITDASTGAFTYTPNANASGNDSFTFKATDIGGLVSNTATVTVTITTANDAPVATNGTLAVTEDVAKTGTLAATDADGDALTYSVVAQGTKGSVTVTNTATGAFTYTPNANANGNDSFTFKATDAGGLASNVATVTATITAVNDIPVAQNGTLAVTEDVAKTGTLAATDADGDALTYSMVAQGAKGTVAITNSTTGAFTYTPNANASGSDSFTFKATDVGGLASNVATVTVTITAANDAPVATNGTLAVTEDLAKTGTLAATDADGDALTYSVVAQGTKGSVAVTNTATGAFTYTPNANASGSDSFTFKATDVGGLASNVATVTVTITAANDAPVATNGTLAVTEDLAKTGTLAATDADGDALTYSVVAQGTKGSVAVTNTATGAFTYTPNANANGNDSFTFKATDAGALASNTATVTVTITAVNDTPVATNGTLAVTEDVAKTGTLAATDADGDSLTYSVVAQGTKGAVTITDASTGAFTYTPNANASGNDGFTFKATDIGGLVSNTATVTVTITTANDAPVATNGTLAVTEDVAKTGTLAATDADGDSLTYSVVAQGTKGAVTITDASTGAFTYTPNANASGNDSFTFKATDIGGLVSNTATVTVTITTANDAPVATNGTLAVTEDVAKTGTLAATDADGDSLTYSVVAQGAKGSITVTNAATGAFTYTPNANANGNDSFTFKATDAGGLASNVATVAVTITVVNDAPTISAIADQITSSSAAIGPLAITVADIDSPVASLTLGAVSSNPTLVPVANIALGGVETNRTLTVTPATGQTGTAAITITVSDGAATASATFTLTVNSLPPQISSALTASGTKNQAFTYQILASNNPSGYGATGLPGGLSVNTTTGVISGTPTTTGTSIVSLSATNAGGTGTATLTLTVGASSPKISTGTAKGKKNQPFSYQIVASDAPTSYGATALPEGLSVDTGTGLISGVPTTPGQFTIILSATNDVGTATETLPLTVEDDSASFDAVARGRYNGLAMPDTPARESTGSVKISVTATGKFTGLINLAGVKYPLIGRFDPNGVACFGTANRTTKSLRRTETEAPLELSLQLEMVADFYRVTGVLSNSGLVVSTIEADQAIFTDAKQPVAPYRNVPQELAGAYTFILPPAPATEVDMPQGNGFGWIKVRLNGSIHIAGALADGVAFARESSLAPDGSLPLYLPLYRRSGAICGQISLVLQNESDVNGTLVWFKPAKPGRTFYPAGWPDGSTLNLRGSHYDGSTGAVNLRNPLAADASGASISSVKLGGGDLTAPVEILASVTGNTITPLPPIPLKQFTVTIKSAHGIFKGSFIHPVTKVAHPFKGVLLQNQDAAAGFFLGITQSGSIEVVPGAN